MKFSYVTSQKYPSSKADPFFWRSMAEAFQKTLGNDFVFVVRNTASEALPNFHTLSLSLPYRFRKILYFLVTPFLVMKQDWNGTDRIIFSADPYLLAIFIFWKKTLRLRYRVCSDWHQMFGDWKDSFIASGSDYLITTSERLKGKLVRECGVNPSKALVAYGGTNPTIFNERRTDDALALRTRLNLPEKMYLVGYVGAFKAIGQEKGLRTMIEALPLLPEEVKMVFVGGSSALINEYCEYAKEQGVDDRCFFLEKKPFPEFMDYELAMDILVIPYPDEPHFRDFGFPMKVWEYMAAGKPIIYSNLEIMAEILLNRGTAFKAGDAHNLAEAVVRVKDAGPIEITRAMQNITDVEAYTWQGRAKHIINFVSQ